MTERSLSWEHEYNTSLLSQIITRASLLFPYTRTYLQGEVDGPVSPEEGGDPARFAAVHVVDDPGEDVHEEPAAAVLPGEPPAREVPLEGEGLRLVRLDPPVHRHPRFVE